SRRESRCTRRKDRQTPVAYADRRQHGGVAHQLRRRRPPVRGSLRWQRGVRVRPSRAGPLTLRPALLAIVALVVSAPAPAPQYSGRGPTGSTSRRSTRTARNTHSTWISATSPARSRFTVF